MDAMGALQIRTVSNSGSQTDERRLALLTASLGDGIVNAHQVTTIELEPNKPNICWVVYWSPSLTCMTCQPYAR